MKKSEHGFSMAEIVIALLVIGIVGGAGWYVKQSSDGAEPTNKSTSDNTTSEDTVAEEETKAPTTYKFEELGISMDILDGWEVKADRSKVEDANFYSWSVEKRGSDGKIVLSSASFQGGFSGCEDIDGSSLLTQAKISEITTTQNENLMFMSWSYDYDGETETSIGIVRSDETIFSTTNNSTRTRLTNKDLEAGTHYLCLGEPTPGFSLQLNTEPAPYSYSRKDSIRALTSDSSDPKYTPLSPNAQSYEDIRTMLISVK